MHPNVLVISLLAIPLASAMAMMLVGSLVAMATALGQRHWIWGIAILLFMPVSFAYVLFHRNSAPWPGKLLLWGFAILVISLLMTYLYQLNT